MLSLLHTYKDISRIIIPPFIGGDFNSRVNDLNTLVPELEWQYDDNVDTISNAHGINFMDLCRTSLVLPLNHLIKGNSILPGQFSYFKAGKKSQIDFVLTNNASLNYVTHYSFINVGWHVSDHIPLSLHVNLPRKIPLNVLVVRASELNRPPAPLDTKLFSFRGVCDSDKLIRKLHAVSDNPIMVNAVQQNDPDLIVEVLTSELTNAVKSCRLNQPRSSQHDYTRVMQHADEQYRPFTDALLTDQPPGMIQIASDEYSNARKLVTLDGLETYVTNLIVIYGVVLTGMVHTIANVLLALHLSISLLHISVISILLPRTTLWSLLAPCTQM